MGVDLSRSTPSSRSNVLDRIQGEAGGLGQGLASGLTGIIGGIGQALRGIFTPGGLFAPVGEAMQDIRDGQEDLADRTDLLSPLLDYGSAYMPNSLSASGSGNVKFTRQLGPMRGCELIDDADGGIRLLDKGLWDIRVQATLGAYFTVTESGLAHLRLYVYRPDGTLYSQQVASQATITAMTLAVTSSVVVPEPGYRVRAYIWSQRGSRGWLRGPAWTRLSVQHIAREVDGAWGKGNEPSDTASE